MIPKKEAEEIASAHSREEEDVAQILSQKYGMQYVDLSLVAIDSNALKLIPEETSRGAEVAAFAHAAKALSLAVHNPGNPALAPLLEDLDKKVSM